MVRDGEAGGVSNLCNAAVSGFECDLVQGASNVLDGTLVDLPTAGAHTLLTLQAATTVTTAAGDAVTVRCNTRGLTGPMRTYFTHLDALQVGTITVQ